MQQEHCIRNIMLKITIIRKLELTEKTQNPVCDWSSGCGGFTFSLCDSLSVCVTKFIQALGYVFIGLV